MSKLSYEKIIADAGTGTSGVRPWIERVEPGIRKELEGIRQRWLDNGRKPPAHTLARSLIRNCREAGVEGIAGETQVVRWLKSED